MDKKALEAQAAKEFKALEKIARKKAKEYGWADFELSHAIGSIDDSPSRPTETVIKLPSGREIHCPAYPEPCSYVRIVQDQFELAYWVCDEWQEDPEYVMGAIIGAMMKKAGAVPN
jgi:hypothetical protein